MKKYIIGEISYVVNQKSNFTSNKVQKIRSDVLNHREHCLLFIFNKEVWLQSATTICNFRYKKKELLLLLTLHLTIQIVDLAEQLCSAVSLLQYYSTTGEQPVIARSVYHPHDILAFIFYYVFSPFYSGHFSQPTSFV